MNRGLSFRFILDKLPRTSDIFSDASTEWGIGGCFKSYYFKYSWKDLSIFNVEFICRMELLAALVALVSFQHLLHNRYLTMITDNTNVVSWLQKGRSSHPLGWRFLAIWELTKYKVACKVAPRWIPSEHNCTADALSRGRTPRWLRERGTRVYCNLNQLAHDVLHADESWDDILNCI